jgi:hypothetical protein
MTDLLAAGAIPGIASSLMTFGDIAWRVLKRIEEYKKSSKEIPLLIRHIDAQLQILVENLEALKQYTSSSHMIQPETGLAKAIFICEEQMKHLGDLTMRLLPGSGDSRTKRAMKAIFSLYIEKEIAKTWAVIEQYKTSFIFYFTTIAVKTQTPEDMMGTTQVNQYILPSCDISFSVPRPELMSQLYNHPNINESDGINIKVRLSVGGQGKTQLALK